MQIADVIWLDQIVEKLTSKHAISPEEVEEVLRNALIVSARDMDDKKRRQYAKK